MTDHPRAESLVASLMREYLAPPERISVSAWAERHRMLSAKDSSEPGPYRIGRTPYAALPQDDLSIYSPVREVVLMWGAQTGKSSIGMNWVGSTISLNPGPMMIVQPTIDTAKRFSRQRLTPMVEESDTLKRAVRENRSRDDANTTLLKEYPGGFLVLSGANSASGLRSMPIRDVFFDEIDAYPLDVDGEGDPIGLAQARQTTFSSRKTLKTSTPTTKGVSRIEEAFMHGNQMRYHVACPHCNEPQTLEWGASKNYGFKWHKDDAGRAIAASAHYVCKHNGCVIDEHAKPAMLANGQWIADNPAADPAVRSYHLSSLYSPLGWLSWSELVEEWDAAQVSAKTGDTSKLRAFVNTRLAETFEEQGTKADHHELARRAESYELGIVPRGAYILTAGVDVQANRIEMRVWGFGRGEESWLVDRHIIYGDVNLEEGTDGSPWSRLTDLRRTPVRYANTGAQLMIESVAIDTGYQAHAVYKYCRDHAHAHVLAVKGDNHNANHPAIGKPRAMDINWRGKVLPRSVKLWGVGGAVVKTLIYGRLNLTKAGAGYIHLPKSLADTDEFEQLTSERLVTRYIKGRPRSEWINPPGKRNEALDCAVYAYAAACYMGIQSMREAGWARRENKLDPKESDLFSSAARIDPPESAPQAEPLPEPRPNTMRQSPRRAMPSASTSW